MSPTKLRDPDHFTSLVASTQPVVTFVVHNPKDTHDPDLPSKQTIPRLEILVPE